jgi:hypothetical protein
MTHTLLQLWLQLSAVEVPLHLLAATSFVRAELPERSSHCCCFFLSPFVIWLMLWLMLLSHWAVEWSAL